MQCFFLLNSFTASSTLSCGNPLSFSSHRKLGNLIVIAMVFGGSVTPILSNSLKSRLFAATFTESNAAGSLAAESVPQFVFSFDLYPGSLLEGETNFWPAK